MKGIEHHETGGATFTGEGISFMRETMILRGMLLEMKGLRLTARAPSCFTIAKREYGLKGNKARVLEQFQEILRKKLQEMGATQQDIDALVKVGRL